MIAGLKKVFALYNKYSFFYNEISSLLDRDEKLNELYLENYRLKTEMLKKQFALMENAGMLIRGFSVLQVYSGMLCQPVLSRRIMKR